jgi:serine protease AprX
MNTATQTPSVTPSVTPVFAESIHVGDLDGTRKVSGQSWVVTVTIKIHNSSHVPIANATVTGTWSGAYSGSGSCVTTSTGTCTLKTGKLSGSSITFTVKGLTYGTLPYMPINNHDLDGDSNGTSIIIFR